jgi:hypothetical protein
MDDFVVNRPVKGAVFGYEIVSHGMATQGHQVLVDDGQWRTCEGCPERTRCFEFSLGKAFMERALVGR